MKYNIEVYSHAEKKFKMSDTDGIDLNNLLNHSVSDEGYKLHSVIPIINDEGLTEKSIVITEKDQDITEYVTVCFYDNATGKMFYEYERTNVGQLLNILKQSEEVDIELGDTFYRGQYVKSQFSIIDGEDYVSEILSIYLDLPSDELEIDEDDELVHF